MTTDRLMKLMAYADGELEAKERAEVEILLATDEDAKKVVAQMRSLGGVVRATQERDAKAIASFDIADAVMARLSATNVVSLEARRARRAKVAMGAAALAVAAAVAFFMRGANEEAPMAKGPTMTPAPAESIGVEVEAVQSPGVSVSVFQVPDEGNLTTSVVVWVDETGDK